MALSTVTGRGQVSDYLLRPERDEARMSSHLIQTAPRFRETSSPDVAKTALAIAAIASCVLPLVTQLWQGSSQHETPFTSGTLDFGNSSLVQHSERPFRESHSLQLSANCIQSLVAGSLGALFTGSVWSYLPGLFDCVATGVNGQTTTTTAAASLPQPFNRTDEDEEPEPLIATASAGGVVLVGAVGAAYYYVKRRRRIELQEANLGGVAVGASTFYTHPESAPLLRTRPVSHGSGIQGSELGQDPANVPKSHALQQATTVS